MNESGARSGNTSYNLIAGQSVERLAAVSDGIFAVAMTLLVLDLHDPPREGIHGEQDLWRALSAMFPQFITYLMSFLTLAIFWNGQQAQKAIERRIVGGQALYALGALLCVVNTSVSIALIALVQLNFAVAPRIRWLSRI